MLFRVGENTFRQNNEWNQAQRQLMMIKLNTTSSIQFWSWRVKVCVVAFRILLLCTRFILCSSWKTAAGRMKQFSEKVHFLYQKAQLIFYFLPIYSEALFLVWENRKKIKTFYFPLTKNNERMHGKPSAPSFSFPNQLLLL